MPSAAIIRRRRLASGEPVPDTTAPTVSSATLASDGVTLTVTFNEALDGANDTAAGEWAVSASSTTTSVSTAAIASGADVTVTLGTAVGTGETVTVDYSGTSLRDAAGNQVATFTGESVTNNSTQTAPAAFPQTLFTADEPGYVVDASDISSLWQDDSASTAVASDGDPVALVQDISGSANGVDHSTSVSGERPTYKDDGTYQWIESDGIDDALESTANLDMTGTDVWTAVFAVRSLDTSGGQNIVWGHNALDGNKILYAPRTSSIDVRALANGGSTITVDEKGSAYDPPADMVMRVEGDLTNDHLKLWLDGTLVGTATGLGASTDWKTEVSELFNASANIRFYGGIVIGRALTTTETDDAEQWAADRSPVTL